MNTDRVVEELFRHESGRLLSYLMRRFGMTKLDLVEDIVQDTLIKALKNWSIKGVPDNPSAWLTTTARNLAIDALRRHPEDQIDFDAFTAVSEGIDDRQDRISMMFACCDPTLPVESQLALTLHMLGGMSSSEIAGCLCSRPNTVEQKISRAKRRLRQNPPRFDLPAPDVLPDRLGVVLQVLYQMFGAGYAAHMGDEAVRIDLCSDALFLLEHLLENPETDLPATRALMAVFLHFAARIPSRTDDWGNVLRLQEQDRDLWDKALLTRAVQWFERSLSGGEVSRYHYEAAILTEHAKASSFEETNWLRITRLYDDLLTIDQSQSVLLSRAISMGMALGSEAGLDALNKIEARNHPTWHAARARFLRDLGRVEESKAAFSAAATLSTNSLERKYFQVQASI